MFVELKTYLSVSFDIGCLIQSSPLISTEPKVHKLYSTPTLAPLHFAKLHNYMIYEDLTLYEISIWYVCTISTLLTLGGLSAASYRI